MIVISAAILTVRELGGKLSEIQLFSVWEGTGRQEVFFVCVVYYKKCITKPFSSFYIYCNANVQYENKQLMQLMIGTRQ